MKSIRYVILTIILTAVVQCTVSCSDDLSDSTRYDVPGNEIAFSLSTGIIENQATRSAEINTIDDFFNLNAQTGFRVKALYADNGNEYFPLMTALPINASNSRDNRWFLTPYKYWPGRRSLCFQAFAPASAETLLTNLQMTNNLISFNYTAPTTPATETIKNDAEVQPDLMFATSVYSHYGETGHSDLAPLNFRHALSAIKFAVNDTLRWTVVSISLKGVNGTGDCTFTSADGFTWSNHANPTNYTETFNYTPSGPATGGDGKPIIPVINDSMPEKTLMLIPQTIPADAQIELTLKSNPRKEGEQVVTRTLTASLETTEIPAWDAEKEYVYILKAKAASLDITVSVRPYTIVILDPIFGFDRDDDEDENGGGGGS